MAVEPRRGGIVLRVFAALVYIFLFAPIIVVALTSFNPTGRATIPDALTTQWYSELSEDDQLIEALWTSVQVGIGTAIIASVLGLLAAYGLSRYRFPGRGALQGLFYLPMLVPAVVSGVSPPSRSSSRRRSTSRVQRSKLSRRPPSWAPM